MWLSRKETQNKKKLINLNLILSIGLSNDNFLYFIAENEDDSFHIEFETQDEANNAFNEIILALKSKSQILYL